jgi:hypothetical protein
VAAHGNEEGPVEDPVGFVEGDLSLARRFSDHPAAAALRGERLRETHHVQPGRATREVPARRSDSVSGAQVGAGLIGRPAASPAARHRPRGAQRPPRRASPLHKTEAWLRFRA